MNVLFSVELALGGSDWLLYGVDTDFLMARPDIFKMEPEEFLPYAKEHGITIIQAHPLRDGAYTPHPEIADGLEVINACPRHENHDDQLFELAQKHNLLMSAGSDVHLYEDVGVAAVLSENEIKTVDDYLELLNSRKQLFMRNGQIVNLKTK